MAVSLGDAQSIFTAGWWIAGGPGDAQSIFTGGWWITDTGLIEPILRLHTVRSAVHYQPFVW